MTPIQSAGEAMPSAPQPRNSIFWRIRSLTVTNDKSTFDPSDIFYALNDLHHLTTMARMFMDDMSYPEGEAGNTLQMLAGVVKIISDDVSLIRAAAAAFDDGRKWEVR